MCVRSLAPGLLLVLVAAMLGQPAARGQEPAQLFPCLVVFTPGNLTGTVTGSGGTPAAGLVTTLFTTNGDIVRAAVTTGSGAFSFGSLQPGNYLLRFESKDGDQSAWYNQRPDALSATPIIVRGGETTTVSTLLVAGRQLDVTVRDTNGGPVPGAKVEVFRPDGELVASGKTDAQGRIRTSPGLPPGSYRLRAAVGGPLLAQYFNNKPDVSAADPIELTSDPTSGSVTVTLQRGAQVSGIITDAASGSPVPNATVFLSGRGVNGFATSDAQGRYTTSGLPSGIYRFEVAFNGGMPSTLARVSSTITITAPNELTGVNIALRQGATIQGSVAGEDGVPLADVEVFASHPDDIGMSAETDQLGRYAISGLPAGTYLLSFSNGALNEYYDNSPNAAGARRVDVGGPGTTTVIDAVLPTGGVVAGRVLGSDGQPLARADIMVLHPTSLAPFVSERTETDGTYRTTTLPAGEYLLQVRPNQGGRICPNAVQYGGGAGSSANAGRFRVVPGETTPIDIGLTTGSQMSGRVTDAATGLPVSGARVSIYDSGGAIVAFGSHGADGTQRSGANLLGRWRADNGLSDGTYRVLVQARGYAPLFYGGATTLAAATGVAANATNVDVALTRAGSLSGRVAAADTGRPLERAEVIVYGPDGGEVDRDLTIADGSFSFNGAIPAGVYRLGATAGRSEDGLPFFTGYDPIFSGGVTTLAAAQTITITPGGAETVNLAMPPTGWKVYLPALRR